MTSEHLDADTVTVPPHIMACAMAKSLSEMLELEFSHLKSQDLDAFDARQEGKNDLLLQLSNLSGVRNAEDADKLGPEWNEFKSLMRQCRDLHRRNEIFIQRKLDAIRGAIQSMRMDEPTSSVEMYDRLGKVSRQQKGRGYLDV